MGTITYHTAQIADAAAQIQTVSQQTEENRLRSINIVTANAENFNGRGSDAFQTAINAVNHRYQAIQETIHRASNAINQANDDMTQRDGQAAAQYG